MLVVADSTPINILVRIQCAHVLGELFESVLIPPEVQLELSRPHTPAIVRAFMANPPPWLSVRVVRFNPRIVPLDPGEEAAINLANEAHAEAILIDEKAGRRAARRFGLTVIGTIGILELAARRRLLDLPLAFQRLAETDFRISSRLLAEALERHPRSNPDS